MRNLVRMGSGNIAFVKLVIIKIAVKILPRTYISNVMIASKS